MAAIKPQSPPKPQGHRHCRKIHRRPRLASQNLTVLLYTRECRSKISSPLPPWVLEPALSMSLRKEKASQRTMMMMRMKKRAGRGAEVAPPCDMTYYGATQGRGRGREGFRSHEDMADAFSAGMKAQEGRKK